ncbi:ParB-like nuclease domain protein [Mycobacterium phage Familton]|nr:ParB-like nuclease domain protein [Mycobacterium phage Familton]
MTETVTGGELMHVDPNELVLEANVRTEASLTKQFVASIKENGVIVPITAVRGEDGVLHVRAGQRRTLAAREAELAEVPVYVIPAELDTATRLVQQITENDQRLELGEPDRVKGIQMLLDAGLSVTKVAKRLSVSSEKVKHAKAVSESSLAMESLTEGATLAEAAGIAEFADDVVAVERLMRAAGRNYFEHELQRQRQLRAEAEAKEAAKAQWAERGYEVLDEYPSYDGVHVPMPHLRTPEGAQVDESVVTDPKHWAVTITEDTEFHNAEGEVIDETTVDWSTEGDPEAVPEEGKLHADTVTEVPVWVPQEYFCIDLEAAGLIVSDRYKKLAAAAAQLPEGSKLESAEELAEKAKARDERKRVVALNKAGDAAMAVRREFVASLLKRKTPPEGAARFVAEVLTQDGTLLGSHRGDEVAGELLGAEVRSGVLLDHASDGRAQVVVLGLTLGAIEAQTPKSAWRSPGGWTEKYLRFLAEHGYGLSPIEKVMIGEMTQAECLEELA